MKNEINIKLFQSGLRWLWITLLVIAIDHYTKVLIQQSMQPYESWYVMPSLNLTLQYNKGAAFSFLDSAAGWQLWIFGILAVGISLILMRWMQKISAKQRWLAIALALIIGGALGNLWDRISYGHVIDFIDIYAGHWHWPVFNIADSAICVGAFMLIIDSFSKKT